MRRFHDATGISDDDWGEYWAQYGDLQREAGYEPSTWPTPALEAELVLEKYIALLRNLGRVRRIGSCACSGFTTPSSRA